MKVLQTVKYYHPSKGGMESVVKNIVEGVSEVDDGIKFTVYSNNHASNFRNTAETYDNIHILREATPVFVKSQPLNIRYKSLPKFLAVSDVVHHHYPYPNMEFALVRNARILRDKRLIITWHANIENSRWGFMKKYYDPLVRRLLSLARYIVVTSPQLFEHSVVLKDFKDKVRVIPLSFDPTFGVEGTAPKTIALDKPRNILFVGKLRAYKGVSYLIDAIRDSDALLTIVGEGEEEVNLRNQVKLLGLESRVSFLKGVDNTELIKIYRQSDLFVLPSISEAEAFGVVQLEAMAQGLPVINTNLRSGVPFVSLDKVTGVTVEPKSSENLSLAINTLLNNKALYEAYSLNSMKRSRLFTREKLALAYLELYQA